MAKKTSSFNLEKETYADILAYQKEHELSSRNAALEFMLAERKTMLFMIKNNKHSSKMKTKEEKAYNNDDITNSIEDNFNNMPE